jgi:hypothetical protein
MRAGTRSSLPAARCRHTSPELIAGVGQANWGSRRSTNSYETVGVVGSNDAASAIGGHEVVGVIGSDLTPPNGLVVERPGAIDIVTPFHPAT